MTVPDLPRGRSRQPAVAHRRSSRFMHPSREQRGVAAAVVRSSANNGMARVAEPDAAWRLVRIERRP
jgi:hypothetical protein